MLGSSQVERLFLRSVDGVLRSPLTREAVDRVLRSTLVLHVVDTVVRGPIVDAALRAAEEAEVPQRLADRLIRDGIADELVARLLESEELWLLVDEVARSPAVTDAISHQGAGLADQVAAVVRDRSRKADARLETAARRVLGRNGRVVPE
jgi:hypothetical protein